VSIETLAVLALISGLIGAVLNEARGHGRLGGFAIGAFFGVLGLAFIALRPRGRD